MSYDGNLALAGDWPPSATYGDSLIRSYSVVSTPSAYALSQPTQMWLSSARHELQALNRLKADWNSYGAVPPSATILQAASDLLAQIASYSIPAPSIVPTSDGSVQLEWHSNDMDIELRFRAPSRFGLYFEDALTGEEDEIELEYDLTPLQRALGTLASR